MSELNYNRREFLAFTGLALAVPAISAISAAETAAPARCLVSEDQGQPLPAAGFERSHLCDQLMRPFTTPIDAVAGEVRFTPPPIRPSKSGCLYQYPVSAKRSSTRMTAERGTLADP